MAHLLIQTGTGTPTVHELNGSTITIGRSPENTIVLDDVSVSSRHAEIVPAAGGWRLRDLGSSNGTTRNGAPVQEVVLEHSDTVAFGAVSGTFEGTAVPLRSEGGSEEKTAEILPEQTDEPSNRFPWWPITRSGRIVQSVLLVAHFLFSIRGGFKGALYSTVIAFLFFTVLRYAFLRWGLRRPSLRDDVWWRNAGAVGVAAMLVLFTFFRPTQAPAPSTTALPAATPSSTVKSAVAATTTSMAASPNSPTAATATPTSAAAPRIPAAPTAKPNKVELGSGEKPSIESKTLGLSRWDITNVIEAEIEWKEGDRVEGMRNLVGISGHDFLLNIVGNESDLTQVQMICFYLDTNVSHNVTVTRASLRMLEAALGVEGRDFAVNQISYFLTKGKECDASNRFGSRVFQFSGRLTKDPQLPLMTKMRIIPTGTAMREIEQHLKQSPLRQPPSHQ